jgi:hypothetical protein
MEQAHASDAEETVWTEERILEAYRQHTVNRKYFLVPVLFVVCVGLALMAYQRWWGCEDHSENLDRLLTTRSCEGCDLYQANLAGAVLPGANLRRARLKGTDLSVADLSHADLRDADLSYASLYRANLSGADLRGANLAGTHLLFANLSRATWVDGTTCSVRPKR